MSTKKTYKPGDIVTVSGIEFVILDTVETAFDDDAPTTSPSP